jgi:hypothetical protein
MARVSSMQILCQDNSEPSHFQNSFPPLREWQALLNKSTHAVLVIASASEAIVSLLVLLQQQ